MIVGCDYHPGFQQIAGVDTETGEVQERRLEHREEAEKFYRNLAAQGAGVRVGMEGENDAVFLLSIVAHISATGVGVYVRQNKERSGRRSSPSLECSPLPGLRGHQQQSR